MGESISFSTWARRATGRWRRRTWAGRHMGKRNKHARETDEPPGSTRNTTLALPRTSKQMEAVVIMGARLVGRLAIQVRVAPRRRDWRASRRQSSRLAQMSCFEDWSFMLGQARKLVRQVRLALPSVMSFSSPTTLRLRTKGHLSFSVAQHGRVVSQQGGLHQ